MAINIDPLKKAFDTLKEVDAPSVHQKEKMLNLILFEGRLQEDTPWQKFRTLVFVYPWRFAFGVSTAQAVVFTLFFGTQYTNLFLGFWGG